MSIFDLLISNVRVVNHDDESQTPKNIAIRDGLIFQIGADLDKSKAKLVVDGGGKVAYPGAIDGHQPNI